MGFGANIAVPGANIAVPSPDREHVFSNNNAGCHVTAPVILMSSGGLTRTESLELSKESVYEQGNDYTCVLFN